MQNTFMLFFGILFFVNTLDIYILDKVYTNTPARAYMHD
jgi:hypothetical protein